MAPARLLPVALSTTGAVLVVKTVESTARGAVCLLERVSDGAQVSVEVPASAAGTASLATGTVVTVSTIGAGVLLSAAGEAIAFIPNALGRALLHNERVTPRQPGPRHSARQPGWPCCWPLPSPRTPAVPARSTSYRPRPWNAACCWPSGPVGRVAVGAWSVLDPALQQRLVPLLRDNGLVARMHHRPYSMVSYAWGTRYQQSNQWALAQPEPVRDRVQAQAWLWRPGYQPTSLTVGPLTRMGGRLTAANVAFDDHPPAKRFSDRIETTTVDSAFAWLQRSGLGAAPVTVQP